MKKSVFLSFLTGYEDSKRSFDESASKRILEKTFTNRSVSGVGGKYARKMMNGTLTNLIKRLNASLCYTSSRTYGFLLLAFGITTLFVHFLADYFGFIDGMEVFPLIAGSALSIIGIILTFTNRPISLALEDFPPTDFILFEFFRMKRMHDASEEYRTLNPALAILLGVLLATLGFFVSVKIVLGVVCALLFISISMASPEFTFLFTIASLPYVHLFSHPTLIVTALVMVCNLSFIRKVLVGKRIYFFEQYDVLILLFALFFLVSGTFNKGLDSFESALVLAALAFAYVPASNLITNRRIAECTFNAVIVFSLPPAILAICEYAFGVAKFNWLDSSFAGLISGRATATFSNPNILAVYLIVAVIFSLGYSFSVKNKKFKLVYVAIFMVDTAALIFTWTRGAWVAVAISLVVFLIMKLKKFPGALLITLAATPYLLFFLPESVLYRIASIFGASDSSTVYRLSVWRSSIRMFLENVFTGVGVGSAAFNDEFAHYAESGVTSPEHSHNLFLEIGCEAGIFALLLFIAVLVVRAIHHSSYLPYTGRSTVGLFSTVTAVALFALIIFGVTDYIFYDNSMYYLFFTVFGMGSSLLRISRNQHDDRLIYYSDMNPSSSATDVKIG
ncbi:MAG: O-antigen ligase family protein [Clostridia bacterium]|nr:O-antigen ligase family protein [Clostridia bacterium]MBQ8720129.1 O-antigen ligase family protein [Clostridia bacterium]